MTTVLEMKQAVSAMTGDINSVMFFPADLIRYINQGLQEIGRDLKLSTNVVTGTTLSNVDIVGGVLLPTDFVIEQVVYMSVDSSSMALLSRIPQIIYWQDTVSPTVSQPTAYTITDYLSGVNVQNRHLLPWPPNPPNGTMNYRIIYQDKPATIAVDTDVLDIPNICDEMLMFFVVSRCKLQENDFAAYQTFKGLYDERKKGLMGEFGEHGDFEFYRIRDEITPAYDIWE
jgi:hypothetical protein